MTTEIQVSDRFLRACRRERADRTPVWFMRQPGRLIRTASPFPLTGFSGAPFTLASYLIEGGPSRDYLVTKAVMHQAPAVWAQLMELLTDMVIRYLRAQVASGVHAVQLFDS